MAPRVTNDVLAERIDNVREDVGELGRKMEKLIEHVNERNDSLDARMRILEDHDKLLRVFVGAIPTGLGLAAVITGILNALGWLP